MAKKPVKDEPEDFTPDRPGIDVPFSNGEHLKSEHPLGEPEGTVHSDQYRTHFPEELASQHPRINPRLV